VILIYLVNTKLEFLENRYSDKGRRMGTLIEEWPGQWGFHAERGAGGLTALMLLAITVELTRLNARSMASESPQEASQATLGHIVPETPSNAL
jgi:hypothetical protein